MFSYLEGSVALRANLVLSAALGVHEMTETVEHDLVPPAKLPVALTTADLPSGGSFIPVHPAYQTLAYVELVVHLPLLQLALLPFLVHHPGHPLVVLHFLDPHLLRQFLRLVLGQQLPLLLHLLGMILQEMLVKTNNRCMRFPAVLAWKTIYERQKTLSKD